MIVDIEEVQKLQSRIDEINSVNLADIEWRKDGVKIDVSSEEIDGWKFVGLRVCLADLLLDQLNLS